MTDPDRPPAPPPGWYDDPSGEGGLRYWNGTQWTSRAPAAPEGAVVSESPSELSSRASRPQSPDTQSTQPSQPSAQEATAASIARVLWQNRAPWGQIIANLFSLRLFYVTAMPSLIVGAILGYLIWEPLAYLAIPLFFTLWLALAISPTTVAYCPFCSKRVKLGLSACHHCGRAV